MVPDSEGAVRVGYQFVDDGSRCSLDMGDGDCEAAPDHRACVWSEANGVSGGGPVDEGVEEGLVGGARCRARGRERSGPAVMSNSAGAVGHSYRQRHVDVVAPELGVPRGRATRRAALRGVLCVCCEWAVSRWGMAY